MILKWTMLSQTVDFIAGIINVAMKSIGILLLTTIDLPCNNAVFNVKMIDG